MTIKLRQRNGAQAEAAPSGETVCPKCGHHAVPGEHFCAECGQPLSHVILPTGAISPTEGSASAGRSEAPTIKIDRPAPAEAPSAPTGGNGKVPMDVGGEAVAAGGGGASLRRRIATWFADHHKFLIVALGVLALAIGGAVAYILLKPASTAPSETKAALTASAVAVNESNQVATRARLVADVRNAGSQANGTLDTIERQQRAVAKITDQRYRAPANRLLGAEVAYERDMAKLAGLRMDNPKPMWTQVEPALKEDALAIKQAAPKVKDLGLASAAVVIPSTSSINHAIGGLDGLINHAAQRLSVWQTNLAQAKAKQASDLQAANNYADTMRGYFSQYDDLRAETADFVARVDSQGATFNEVYQFLGDGMSARQNLKDSIANLSAPAPLAPAQSEIETVLGKSVTAMGNASSGIASYQFQRRYTDYKQTPGWQQFESASDEISSEYATARSDWETALSQYISSIKQRPMPQRPNV